MPLKNLDMKSKWSLLKVNYVWLNNECICDEK